MQQAGGGAIFEAACVEDSGGFGEGARQVLRFIAEAAFGERPSAVKDLSMWPTPSWRPTIATTCT